MGRHGNALCGAQPAAEKPYKPAGETTGSRKAYEDLTDLDVQVRSAAQRAVDSLALPPVQGNSYTVVIDPILTGLFVHEAFGHLSEADMAYENPDILEIMTLGRQFGPENLQIFDGAAPEGHRGSYLYDDEGTPATTTQLIKDGALVGPAALAGNCGQIGRNAYWQCSLFELSLSADRPHDEYLDRTG